MLLFSSLFAAVAVCRYLFVAICQDRLCSVGHCIVCCLCTGATYTYKPNGNENVEFVATALSSFGRETFDFFLSVCAITRHNKISTSLTINKNNDATFTRIKQNKSGNLRNKKKTREKGQRAWLTHTHIYIFLFVYDKHTHTHSKRRKRQRKQKKNNSTEYTAKEFSSFCLHLCSLPNTCIV